MSLSQTSHDNSTEFFQRLSQNKEATPQPVRKSTRIITGLVIGTLLGLVYGLITQTLNSLFTPSVPFAQYPFGLVGNLIASMVVWTIVGGLCALPNNAIAGVLVGCLAMAGVVILRAWTTLPPQETTMAQILTASATFFSFVVVVLISIPLMFLIRWAVEVQGELALQPLWSWRRLRAPLAAVLLLGVVTGMFTLYTEDVRQAMTQMHQAIEQALTASSANSLPVAFQSDRVVDFLANATHSYTLEQSTNSTVRHDVSPVIGTDFNTSPLLLARFSNGWLLACLINPQIENMRCKSYTALPE